MDRLTQLQDALDQIATQFYCALRYVCAHHDAVPLSDEAKAKDENVTIDDPATFEAVKIELARDIILKSKQIEVLILSLPGIGKSEGDQQAKLRELEKELKDAETERQKAIEEKEEMMEKLDEVIRSIRRV